MADLLDDLIEFLKENTPLRVDLTDKKKIKKVPKLPDLTLEKVIDTFPQEFIRAIAEGPDPDSFLMDLIRNTGELPDNLAELFPLESTPLPTKKRERNKISFGDIIEPIADFMREEKKKAPEQQQAINDLIGNLFNAIGNVPNELSQLNDLAADKLPDMPQIISDEELASLDRLDKQAGNKIDAFRTNSLNFLDSLFSRQAIIPEVNDTPVAGNIDNLLDAEVGNLPVSEDLLSFLAPDSEAEVSSNIAIPSEFNLEEFINDSIISPQDIPELSLPEATQQAIEFDVGSSSLEQEKQRLIAKSDAGLATQSDRLLYQSIVEQLGEVPIFDDVVGDEGFTVTGEFGKPKPETGIDTSGLGGVESLVALQKYQGKLLSDKQKIEEEANKVANTAGPILNQLAVAIEEAQGLADPLAKRFAQEDISNLQVQLSVAQDRDKQLRAEFISSNIGEIDQQLKAITPQIEAARIIAAQEEQAKTKAEDIPDHVLKLVEMDNPGKDPKAILKGSPREIEIDYFIRGQKAIRTPFVDAIATTPGDQQKLDSYYKNAFFANSPELYEAMDILRDNFKLPAIKRVQRNPENFTTGLAAAKPSDREELIKVAIRNEVNRAIPRFADGQFVTNLDWLAIDGNEQSITLINDLKSKGFTSWEKAIDALPNETKADQLLVAKMISNFTDRFSETYAPMGVSIDLSKYFSRYQRSSLTKIMNQLRDISIEESSRASGTFQQFLP